VLRLASEFGFKKEAVRLNVPRKRSTPHRRREPCRHKIPIFHLSKDAA